MSPSTNGSSELAHSEQAVEGSMRRHRPSVHVVGIDGRGCAGMTSDAMNVATRAQILVGGERHLAFFPQHAGQRIVLRGKLTEALEEVAQLAEENDVCILASGDPLFFGVAGLVLKKLGAEHVAVVPTVSSMQLAFSRAQIPWTDASLLSLHGRPLVGVVARLRSSTRAGIFTDEANSPARIAAHMIEYGESEWRAVVCEDLGTPQERVRRFETLTELAAIDEVRPLNVLVLERTAKRFVAPPTFGYLDEESFAKKMPRAGLITKREVRALTIAQLRLSPDATVWDVGAGSGSVGIEASFLAPRGRVFAIEVDEECAGYCRENVRAHGADNVSVIEGRAPEALGDLPAPDAVFVGGTKGSMAETLSVCVGALRDGGRLVVNAITLENVAAAHAAFLELGLEPEVTLFQVSRGAKLARYLRYDAQNPIHLFAATVNAAARTQQEETTR